MLCLMQRSAMAMVLAIRCQRDLMVGGAATWVAKDQQMDTLGLGLCILERRVLRTRWVSVVFFGFFFGLWLDVCLPGRARCIGQEKVTDETHEGKKKGGADSTRKAS